MTVPIALPSVASRAAEAVAMNSSATFIETVSHYLQLIPSGRTVEMIAFRPNIVIGGPQSQSVLSPWEEDQWREIMINGDQSFTFAKPCERCSVPAIIPSLGTRDPDGEPLVTLQKYRTMTPDGKIYFGQWTVQNQKEGVLRVGDRVAVTRQKPPGQFLPPARV